MHVLTAQPPPAQCAEAAALATAALDAAALPAVEAVARAALRARVRGGQRMKRGAQSG